MTNCIKNGWGRKCTHCDGVKCQTCFRCGKIGLIFGHQDHFNDCPELTKDHSWEVREERRNPEVQSKKPMLHRAEELINGQRQADYGDKLPNFTQIAAFWNAQLMFKLKAPITAEDVALCMIGLKAARLAKSPTHTDSVIDIAGYIGCYDKILEERDHEKVNRIAGNHV